MMLIEIEAMNINYIPKKGVPVVVVAPYVLVKSDCFGDLNSNKSAIVMGMKSPHFIGRIFKTTNIERWESFIDTNPYIGANLPNYMIAINIIGSVDEYQKSIPENIEELNNVAMEMIEFYKNEVIDNTKPSAFSRYKIED